MTSVRFLTDEWAAAYTEVLNASEEFVDAGKKHEAILQFHVTGAPAGAPAGDVTYFVEINRGRGRVAVGAPPRPADMEFTSSYETAVQVARGVISGREAYAGKKMTANVGMITLMKFASVFGATGAAQAELDIDFTAPDGA
jgi:hypothetical protein